MYGLARRAAGKLLRGFGTPGRNRGLREEIELLRTRIDSLQLVRNGADQDGEFTCLLPATLEERRLYHSAFNMAWIDELRLSPKVVLDIGAYDGGDSIRFKSRFPDARVVAFEADPDRHAVLAGNVEALGIACVNAAVCDRDGPVAWYQAHDARFDDGKAGSQGSMYRHSPACKQRYDFVRQSATPISVEGIRIDTFCRRAGIDDVDVAHIDVEGAEYDVVAGLGDIRPKLLYVEAAPFDAWIGAKRPAELHRKLSCSGYLLAADLGGDRLYLRADLVRLL